jgi:hypothetical protein
VSSRRRDAIALAALFVAAFALRWIGRVDHDEDTDALRFRLGVERFSVPELRPHAPFYPVYVAAAKLAYLAGASAYDALALIGALSGAALCVLTALLAAELVDRRAALVAGALALASPFLWLTSEKLLSDMAGAAAFTAGLWLAARARRTAALIVLGAALGVRLSYFPIALACLVCFARAEGGGRAYFARARDLLTGVVLWLAPLVAVAGAGPLLRVGLMQGEGHFTRWGGSAITVPSPVARLGGAAWGLWANVLGGAFPDAPPLRWIGLPALLLLCAFALAEARSLAARRPVVAVAAVAYLAWALLGQNVAYKPRHLLPLAPLLIVALAAGATAIARRSWQLSVFAVASLVAIWSADGAALVAAHRAPSPAAALCAHLRDHADDRVVLTADLGRMIREAAPARAVVEVRDPADLVERAAREPAGVLVTSEALSGEVARRLAARGLATRVAFGRPRSRYVDSLWNELALVSVGPAP